METAVGIHFLYLSIEVFESVSATVVIHGVETASWVYKTNSFPQENEKIFSVHRGYGI